MMKTANKKGGLPMGKKTDMIKKKQESEALLMTNGGMQSKKLILFNILDILRKYTDEKHTLSQKDIQDKLEKEYDMIVDRKTIKASLTNLEEFGYELEYKETCRPAVNKKTGETEDTYIMSDFYLRRDFEDSELRLLIDSLLFSRHIPFKQCKELIEKIEKLSNVYFKSRVKHIATMPQDRTDNKQLFYTIDVLDEAISRNRKVRFKYLEYQPDKQQSAKKDSRGKDRLYVVSPYQMAAKEGKYYLICNYDYYADVSNYRLDRISEIEILEDDKAKPFEQLKWADGRRLNLTQYMNEHIYMYSSETSRVKLRIINAMISDMIDIFGKDVRFEDPNETHITVNVRANDMSIVQFAKNYAPDVVILEPQNLRDKVKEALREGLKEYEE